MAQNQELQDFSSFNLLEEKENFIKDIQKQVDLAHMSVAAFPTNVILLNHLHLMRNINDSNFYKLLARRINGMITVRKFAEIFTNLLREVLNTILIN